MTGTIKTLKQDKSFGFIRGEDNVEYFFHKQDCARGVEFDTLEQGERVAFEPAEGRKGPRAADVERA